jgi:signal transduction histidine kinase
MSLVTVIWSMIAAACLTMAGLHWMVWYKQRTEWANLLFAVTATSTAIFVGTEFWIMRAETPADIGTAMRWAHVPLWVGLVALVGFVRLYLRAGRAWLAGSFIGLRTLSLLLDFLTGQNLHYREISTVRRITFLGEPVSVAIGLPNPWMLVGQLSSLALILFAVDASVTVWRRGDRRKALLVGGSVVFFVLVGQAQSMLVFWGVVQMPIIVSCFYLGIVIAMGYELSHDVLHAAKLGRELRESEQSRGRGQQALQHLTGRLLMLQEEERRRVAGELHDGLGQSLAIIKNRAMIGLRDQTNQERVTEQLEEIASTATASILEVREIAHNLRPYELDRLGLVAAIESMVERVSDSTSINLSAALEPIDGLLSPETETSAYRIVQEGLNNVVKHSHATTARIELKRSAKQLVISVQDNGEGIPPPAPTDNGDSSSGFGLAGITERVRVLGGTFVIDSEPSRGTTLTVRLELRNGSEK